MTSFAALREVAGNRSLLLLEAGWTLALAAEGAYLVSILVFAYEVGGIAAVGLVTTLRALPAVFLAPLLAVVADRLPRARVLVGVQLLRAAVVGLATVVALGELPFGLVLGAVVVEGLLVGLHRATTLALMPALCREPEELVAGNAAVSLGEAVGGLVGPLVAGLLLAVDGPALGMAVAAGGHLLASGVAAGVRVVGLRRIGDAPVDGGSAWAAMLVGLRSLRRFPHAGLVVALFGGQTFVRGVLTVAIVATAVELLGIGESGVGFLASAVGAGGLLGASVAMILVGHRSLAVAFATSLAAWGAPVALLGLVPEAGIAFVLLAVVGAANATLDVSGYTLLQRSVPNVVRARAFGALEAVAGLGLAAGAAVAPILVVAFGLPGALVLAGLLLPALAVVAYPRLRHVETHAVVPYRELALLRGVPMFAPLSLTSLEHLAASMDAAHHAAGDRIIVEGEAGDAFYIIASGSVEVVHGGRRVALLAQGGSFGEIALLSDRPRTATVVALEAVESLRLPRAPFLEVVTGSPHSTVVADTVVAQRLAELGQR